MAAGEEQFAVVGGGLAGLAAAWELRRHGRRVALLEREDEPGGRARPVRSEGFAFEPLPSLLSTADRELFAWIAEAGAREELLPLRPVVAAQVHRGRVKELDPRSLLDLARLPGVWPHQALRLARLPRLLARYGRSLDPDAPERAAPLDDRSLADFGRLYFGASVVERWLAPHVAPGDPDETSRVHFLLRHRQRHAARVGLPRAPLAALCEAVGAKLPLLSGATVLRVERAGDGGLRLGYTRAGRERILAPTGVILATPADESARIGRAVLTTGEREILAGVRYAPVLALAVATCRPPGAHPREIHVPRGEGSPIASVLLEPGLPGGRVPDGYGCMTLRATPAYAERAGALPDETLEKELLDALERFQPGARARVEFTRVLRLERALPRFDVGHYRALARLAQVEAERLRKGPRVVATGDYRMDPSFGGAAAAGRRAARTLLAGLV